MQIALSGISISFARSLFLLSPKKTNQTISHRFYQLLKKQISFIAIIVCSVMQGTICLGDEYDDSKSVGELKISNIINSYDNQLADSIGKNDPRYIVKSTSLDLLKNQKIVELHNRIDEVKTDGDVTPIIKKKLSQIINDVIMETSTASQPILKSEKKSHEWWIILISAVCFFIIIGFTLSFANVSRLVIDSIRPIISLSLTILIFMLSWYALYKDLIEFKELFPLLLSLYGPIVGFYFGERSALKVPGKETEEAEEIVILPEELQDGQSGQPYLEELSASGGTKPYIFSLAKGSKLPKQELSIDRNGKIEGSPTTANTYKFTVQVIDKLKKVGTKDYELKINA